MPKANDLYIGLMSGTSLDAIDAVLVRFAESSANNPQNRAELIATLEHPFPAELRRELQSLLSEQQPIDLDILGMLDRNLGLVYADAVNHLLQASGQSRNGINAIGNHGQTIRHSPSSDPAFTIQIGDAATIAVETGITTVADFRSADIALGGQGAPLVPAFHCWAFGDDQQDCAIVNIGGIANITLLQDNDVVLGFDTGPGNTLMDLWYNRHQGGDYDVDGAWAAAGTVQEDLLQSMLADPYFGAAPPKSTGREYFNLHWLEQHASRLGGTVDAPDAQATLLELTARTIAGAVQDHSPASAVWLCGGGALNHLLTDRLGQLLSDKQVAPTDALGIPASWVEAVAFAWLARARMSGQTVKLSAATGASRDAVPGAVHLAPKS